jgi:large subunit ribosomal protein L15
MSMTHEITSTVPRFKKSQRKGRGESSGRGKTSGRGNKGSKARVGTYIKRGYEGGQTPIFRRFPKRGFSNVNFARRFHIVNLQDLDRFDDGATIDAAMLKDAGLIPDLTQPVKILGQGTVSKKLTILAGWYSKSAHARITEAGGSAQNLKGEAFEFPRPKKKFIPREAGAKKSKKQSTPEAKSDEAPAPAQASAPAPGAAPAAPAPAPQAEQSEPKTE